MSKREIVVPKRNGVARASRCLRSSLLLALVVLVASAVGAESPPSSPAAQQPYAGPVGYEIWIASLTANVVTVIDIADLSVVDTIHLPWSPYTVAVGYDANNDRDLVFVTLIDTAQIVVIDADNCTPGVAALEVDVATQEIVRPLPITNTWGMEFSADGRTAFYQSPWSSCTDAGSNEVRIVDLMKGEFVGVALPKPESLRWGRGGAKDLTRIPQTDSFVAIWDLAPFIVDANLEVVGFPDDPTLALASEYGSVLWEVEVRDASRAYVYGNVINGDEEVFGLLDISNPTMPFYPDLASRLGPPGFNPGAPTADGFEIVGNYAYFAPWDNFRSNTFGAELQAWDLDVDPPVKAASLQMPDETWWLNYFAVREVPAPEQIANIEENAAATLDAAGVPENKEGVTKALEDAADRVDDGDTAKAITALEKAVKSLSQLVKKGYLSAAEAQPLIDAINAMIQELSGGG